MITHVHAAMLCGKVCLVPSTAMSRRGNISIIRFRTQAITTKYINIANYPLTYNMATATLTQRVIANDAIVMYT